VRQPAPVIVETNSVVQNPPVDPAIVSFAKPSTSKQNDGPVASRSSATQTNKPKQTSESSKVPQHATQRQKSSGKQKDARKRKSKIDTAGEEDASRLKGPFTGLVFPPGDLNDDEPVKSPSQDPNDQEEFLEKLHEYQEKLALLESRNKKRVDKVRRELDTIIQSTRSSVSGPSWSRIAEPSPRTVDGTDPPTSSKAFKGKGWRQSPILKPSIPADESNAKTLRHVKKKGRKKRRVTQEELTGWATEDATDIQEMGDFDFEGGLAKFDKRSVFEQLRQEDSIPAEQRLVGHNRLKNISPATRPGTFGGTKLHPTENVLDSTQPRNLHALKPVSRRGSARQPSISSESSEDIEHPAVRTSSRMSSARIRQKRFPIRTNTSTNNIQKLDRVNTGGSVRLEASIHSARHITSSTSNENITRLTPAESPAALMASSTRFDTVHFWIGDSAVKCPTISPGGMTALEGLSSSQQNISPDTLNENAGRSLAEIVIAELLSRSSSSSTIDASTSAATTAPPRPTKPAAAPFTALFLVGNHRVGARALVAARHLRDRGVSSVCCVLGLDRPGHMLDAEVKTQLSMMRTPETADDDDEDDDDDDDDENEDTAAGGGGGGGRRRARNANGAEARSSVVVANWREVVKFLAHNEGGQDAWVDALLAPGHTYDTLVPEEQMAVREMVAWGNGRGESARKCVISVDVPCGINASTGRYSQVGFCRRSIDICVGEAVLAEEDSSIQMRSNVVVCMGAPRTGLLNAMRNAWGSWTLDLKTGASQSTVGEGFLALKVYVVDIGISEIWKSYGEQLELAPGPGPVFGMKWFLTLKVEEEYEEYEEEEDEEDEDVEQ
jgi:enhancer of mRNA-decapping protein 3